MNASYPAAVLWDMDGTIVDTEPMWVAAEVRLLNDWGLTISEADLHAWVGIGLSDLAKDFQSRGVGMSSVSIMQVLTDDVRRQFASNEIAWRPGARELLASLVAASIPTALVTMSLRIQAEDVLSLLPAGTFDVVVAGDDVSLPKPHPEPYLRAAAQLGVPVEECVAIEDSITGLTSAVSAGAVTVGVPNLVDLTGVGADCLLTSLAGITATNIATVFQNSRRSVGPRPTETLT